MKAAFVTVAGISLALCIGAFTTGASTASTNRIQAAPSGTLRMVEARDPGSLDPLKLLGAGLVASYYTTETLVSKQNPALKPFPGLATSWRVSRDGLSWTFNLRRGVRFHDGTQFDARAVKINLDRITNAPVPPPNIGDLSQIRSTEVVSKYVVRLNLSRPLRFLPAILTIGTAGILSPSSFTKFGNAPDNIVVPVGTGPFRFKEYAKGDHITFERNPTYWGRKIEFNTLTIRFVPSAASREAAILAGDADVALGVPPSDLPSLNRNPNLQVLFRPGMRTIYIAINTKSTTNPLLSNVKVRQALNHAIDKRAIVNKILFGMGAISTSPAPLALAEGYCKAGTYPYDPQRARRLLREAGATNLTVKFGSYSGVFIQDFQAATAIAGYLRDVGINVIGPSTTDQLTYNSIVVVPPEKATLDLHLFGITSSYSGLAGSAQFLGLLTTEAIPPGGFNTGYYSSRAYDRAVAKATQARSDKVAAAELCKAQKIAWADAPRIFLWSQTFPAVATKKVRGLRLLPNESVYVYNVTLSG